MKFLLTNNPAFKADKNLDIIRIGGLFLLIEVGTSVKEFDGKLLLNEGYLRDLEREVSDLEGQKEGVTKSISENWPLPENITGSFSALLIEESLEKISLCTDLIGLYPLYYLVSGKYFFISNSIILTGVISGAELDPAGIVQRSLGPEFCNLGSRTILKNCKRLLPGECRRFSFSGELLSIDFDNRLYQDISPASQEHSLWEDYWKAYKTEVEYCLNDSEKVNIALSGGIDSRITLGAIPDDKEITCYTFGSPKNYESQIASRLAKLKQAKFVPCYKPELYFPSREILEAYTAKTEGVELCSWLEITEKVDKGKQEPLLLGELCEALPARKISRFSSKQFRQENFVKYYLRNENYKFEKAGSRNFEKWKKTIFKRFNIYYHPKNLSRLEFLTEESEVKEALEADLEEIFARIAAHNLPYAELYDELFSWYTYTRMRLSKQLLTASSKFRAYSPAMSLQMLRKTSSLHPNLRLNYRFIKKLFRGNKELRKLYRVPTSQAPWIPQNFPDVFKFGMWGLRSKADQYFINRMMRSKDPEKRYRWFESINWALVYQNPDMEKNLEEYFRNNHLGRAYFEWLYNQAVQRKNLNQWPFANMNIIIPASLNIEIDLIKRMREEGPGLILNNKGK